MSLQLTIPDPLAEELEARAAAIGTSASQIALAAIQRELAAGPTLEELLAPVRKAYEDSGMSEDESFDFLEAEKHAMRAERRARRNLS
jgi:hypothetical protein